MNSKEHKLSDEAKQVIKSMMSEFSLVDEFIQCYEGFGICFKCGEIYESLSSPACDNCYEFSVYSIADAVTEID